MRVRIAHEFSGLLCDRVSRSEQHCIGGMDISAGDSVGCVSDQRTYRGIRISEVRREAGETVAQDVRRDVGWQLAVSMNFGPLVLTNIGPPSGV